MEDDLSQNHVPVAPTAAESPLDSNTTEGFERLDKWKGCKNAPKRFVFEHNHSRAKNTGFPTRSEIGKNLGLTNHEVAAVFGWTTGDYRFVNPIARGQESVEFDDYPFLPNSMKKATCELSRQDVMPYVDVLSSAFSKLPANSSSKEVLWRGHRRQVSNKVGTIFTLKGFTSVSRDRDNALTFAEKANEGRSNMRTLIAFVEHSNSRDLAKLSARRDEMEVVFPRDTMFEVVAAPKERVVEDESAAMWATVRLRKAMPGAKIEVVYLKEVTNTY